MARADWLVKLRISCVIIQQIVKPRPNDRNIQRNISQHCWVQHVARVWPPCCDMLGVVGSNLKMVKFFTLHLRMLHDVVVWLGSCNNVASGHAH